MSLDPSLTGQDYCYLTATGRVSGAPHTIEIWFAAPEGEPADGRSRIYLLSGGRERADWVRNLRREPAVGVRVADREFEAHAHVLDGGAEAAEARRLLFEKYQPGYGSDLCSWRDTALPVAVDLARPATER